MVRFSDMLGGDGDANDARAKTAPRDLPPPVVDDPPDPDAPLATAGAAPVEETAEEPVEEPVADAPAPAASAQDVLERLTQYATASRAVDQTAPEAAPDAEPASTRVSADTEPGAGDDILPRGKRSLRNPRGSKRAK